MPIDYNNYHIDYCFINGRFRKTERNLSKPGELGFHRLTIQSSTHLNKYAMLLRMAKENLLAFEAKYAINVHLNKY